MIFGIQIGQPYTRAIKLPNLDRPFKREQMPAPVKVKAPVKRRFNSFGEKISE